MIACTYRIHLTYIIAVTLLLATTGDTILAVFADAAETKRDGAHTYDDSARKHIQEHAWLLIRMFDEGHRRLRKIVAAGCSR